MGRGRLMADIWKELGINIIEVERLERESKREFEDIIKSTEKGSGFKPEKLKIYNKLQKNKYNEDPITARKYISNWYIQTEVNEAYYEVQCTVDFLKEIFDIDVDMKEAAKVSYSIHQSYYKGDPSLHKNIKLYKKLSEVINVPHELTKAKVNNAIAVLSALGEEIPLKLKFAMIIRNKYAKNQLSTVISELVNGFFPEIDDKVILDKIAKKALE